MAVRLRGRADGAFLRIGDGTAFLLQWPAEGRRTDGTTTRQKGYPSCKQIGMISEAIRRNRWNLCEVQWRNILSAEGSHDEPSTNNWEKVRAERLHWS